VSITLIENFRAVFYAPFYATVALGAYAAEGLDVHIKTSSKAEGTIHALIGGEGEISWGGLSRLMCALGTDPRRAPVAFCELIGRDPFSLLGHDQKPHFELAELVGKRVATVAEVPGPWMCLQHDLRLAGIDPNEINRVHDRTMEENVMAFRSGNVDVIQVFQPFVHDLTETGTAHVWHSAATRGQATYTTLNTTRDFVEREPDVLFRMARAVYRTQKWISAHNGHELALAIRSFFPELSTLTLAACCDSYKTLEIWSRNPVVSRTGFEWIRDAGLSSRRIPKEFTYGECVDTRFAVAAMDEDPPSL
jgi:NitT/TauT family transport system substrate-binding protein